MKRFLLSLVLLVVGAVAVNAMSYRKAREYAYFLTDKMAYELNLTPDQYERVYEVNLDYFLSVNDRYDIYSDYWSFRDIDLRYILFDWQYSVYRAADYFYHPISWRSRSFVINVYNNYRYRNDYYYARPRVYMSYHGSSWGNRSMNSVSRYNNMVFSGRRGGMREDFVPYNGGYNFNNGHHYGQGKNYNNGQFNNSQFNNGSRGNSFNGSSRGGSFENRNDFDRQNRGGSFESDRNYNSGNFNRGGSVNYNDAVPQNNSGVVRGNRGGSFNQGGAQRNPSRNSGFENRSSQGSFDGAQSRGNFNGSNQNVRSNQNNSNGNNAQSGSSRNNGTQVFSGRR